MAGCSADCDTMWQIGVDVLPEYRRKGIASALTSRLAIEIWKRDIVPFYCFAWANLNSVLNAINCGFKPAWVQLTVMKNDFIDTLNKWSFYIFSLACDIAVTLVFIHCTMIGCGRYKIRASFYGPQAVVLKSAAKGFLLQRLFLFYIILLWFIFNLEH